MRAAALGFVQPPPECEIIPDVPLAQDELDAPDSSVSSTSTCSSNYSNVEAKKKQQTAIWKDDNMDKVSSNSANLSSSLQDLVETFDDKVTKVLKDFDKDAEKIAPIKIRSQEEIMSESQFWWTLTGNYGNLPPIDFERSQIRRKQLKALDIHSPKEGTPSDPSIVSDEEADEKDRLDFHKVAADQSQLIENGEMMPVSADRVIEEIDEILQAGDWMNQSLATNRTMESVDSMYSSMRSPNISSDVEGEFKPKQNEGIKISIAEMNTFTQSKLITIVSEMEQIVQLYNDELVRELARKDEFEYEKEMRNKFITLLVAVQERRRKLIGSKKQTVNKSEMASMNNNLSTVSIPYDQSQEGPNIAMLEWLVKILQGILDDSAQLPTLLTDYILNVVCPAKSISA